MYDQHSQTFGLSTDRGCSVSMFQQTWHFLLVALAGFVNWQQLDMIAYLQEENQILRDKLGGKRLLLNVAQNRHLAFAAIAPHHPPFPSANSRRTATAFSSTGNGSVRIVRIVSAKSQPDYAAQVAGVAYGGKPNPKPVSGVIRLAFPNSLLEHSLQHFSALKSFGFVTRRSCQIPAHAAITRSGHRGIPHIKRKP